jgi:arsenite-transporting ATPase
MNEVDSNMRIIVYTGKGGVGKTSIAAATAVKLSEQGLKTLIMSTDSAHSLADSLEMTLSSDPIQVAPLLWAQEINSLRETEKNWGAVQSWMTKIMDKAKLSDVTTEEMLVFPGMEELFSLLQIKNQASSGLYDAIIVDCAPTGETLRLLSYPNVLNWWLDKIFPHERRLIKIIRPVAKVVTGGYELPSDDVLDSIEVFVRGLEELQQLLLDPQTTSVRLVLNPEKMVVNEAKRSYTYLNLFGFNTDAVIINRVLPEEAAVGFLAEWRNIHIKYEEEIVHNFNPLPLLKVPLQSSEVVGIAMLKQIGDILFATHKAQDVLYNGRAEEIQKVGNTYLLSIAIPFVEKKEIELSQRGDELTIQVGAYKRKVILLKPLLGRTVAGAKFESDRLLIRFQNPE